MNRTKKHLLVLHTFNLPLVVNMTFLYIDQNELKLEEEKQQRKKHLFLMSSRSRGKRRPFSGDALAQICQGNSDEDLQAERYSHLTQPGADSPTDNCWLFPGLPQDTDIV